MDELVGGNIKFFRNKNAWTQEHLAAASGVNVRTIQRAEDGQHIAAESLQAIAGAFDIGVDDLRNPPKLAAEIKSRYKLVPLEKYERATDMRHIIGGQGAFHFDYVGVTDPEQEQAIAEFQQELHDCGDCWPEMGPLQRHEALAALQPHFDQLYGFGLIVAAGVEKMHLRSKSTDTAFTMEVLRVLISTAAEPKLFLMRDKTQPVQFG